MNEIDKLDNLILSSPRSSAEAKREAMESKGKRGYYRDGQALSVLSQYEEIRWCEDCKKTYQWQSFDMRLERPCCWRRRVDRLINKDVQSFAQPIDTMLTGPITGACFEPVWQPEEK